MSSREDSDSKKRKLAPPIETTFREEALTRMTWTTSPLVTLNFEEETYQVHQDVLTHESEYFKTVLKPDNDFEENKTSSFDFEDFNSDAFGGFVNLMYTYALDTASGSRSARLEKAMTDGLPLRTRLNIWQIADYFQHSTIRKCAERSVRHDIGDIIRGYFNMGQQYATDEQERIIGYYIRLWATCDDLKTPESIQKVIVALFAKFADAEFLHKMSEMCPKPMGQALMTELGLLRSKSAVKGRPH